MTGGEPPKSVCPKCGAAMNSAPSFMAAGAAYCTACGAFPDEVGRKTKTKVTATVAIALAAVVIILIVVRSGGPGTSKEPSKPEPQTPAPAIESAAVALPPPAIIAGPVNGDGLEVDIVGARQEDFLTSRSAYQSSFPSSSPGFPSDNTTSYTPKPGLTFLVVDVRFRNLDASRASIKVSSEEAAVIDKSGKAIKATGSGTEHTSTSSFDSSPDRKDYCVGCKTSFEMTNVQKSTIEVSFSFVFVVKREAVNQAFKFHYNKIPPINFPVSKRK